MMTSRSERVRLALRQIDELTARGRLAEAEPLARRLVAENQLAAPAQFALALIVQSQGRFEQAEPHFARAATLDPRNVNYLLNYGLCLLCMGRVAEAAAQYERARKADPRGFDVSWRYGSFLARLGHMEQALASFEAALPKAPEGAKAQIRLDIIDCLLSLGRVGEAEKLILQHIGTTPFRTRYLCLLSGTRKHDASSEVYARIERELARRDLSPFDRSDLLVRKGALLQNSGRHDEAFATILEGKKILRAPSVISAFTREVDERIAAYPADRLQRLAARFGRSGYAPVFVVGLPRSGTTLAAQIISAHSMAGNAGELETMTWCAARMRGAKPLGEIESSLDSLGGEGVDAIASLYEGTMRYVVPGKERAVDKMPLNFRFIGEASILFPNARFVHCVRHPADTFISAFQTEMNGAHSYSYDPAEYAAYHKQYRRLMAHWETVMPGRIFDLSYERLVAAPEQEIRALLDYLGLPFEEACLSPERNQAAVTTFSRLQVRSGINAGSVGRWKSYERQLRPILDSMDG